jgi:outer membrane protein insertion porin family
MKFRLSALWLLLTCLIISVQAKVLDTLVIEGLSINSPGVVRNALEIREKRSFTTSDIQESIRKLYALGLFKGIDFFIINETDSSASLKLSLIENSICENYEFHGNKKLKAKDLEEKIKLKRGQMLTDAVLFKNEKILRDFYAEKGYNLAEITTEQISTKVPGNVIVKFTIKENAQVRITNITFEGNKQVATNKLMRKFKTKIHKWYRSGDFKQELYKAHLDTLMMFYNEKGFLDASVVKDSVWYGVNKRDLNIYIKVNEGRRYITGNFFFAGNKIIETDVLKGQIALKDGRPFQKSKYDLTKYMVENAYREEGYLWVQVDDQRSFRGDTIDVTFSIVEGRAAVVRKIDIKGNSKTLEKVVRREISCMPGKKYKQSLMMRSRQELMGLGFLADAKPDLIPVEDGTIDLVFDVLEKDNIGQLQIGAALAGNSGFVGTFSTAIPNFRGTGEELKVSLEYGADRQNASLSFTEPWAFDKPLSLGGTIYYTKNETDQEDSKVYGLTLNALRTRLKWPDDHFRLRTSYTISYEESDRQNATYNGLEVIEDGWTSKIGFGIERRDLDLALFPTSGSRISIDPEFCGIGGDFNYFKGMLSYDHYFSLPYKFVLSSRSKFGLIQPLFKDDVYISASDLFSTGGIYGDADLRGYEDFDLFGGYSENQASGLNLYATTLELRYPVLDQQLYLLGFLDYGNTVEKLSDISLTNVSKGVGVGVRLSLPMIGMLGFDFGWGLDYPNEKDLFGKNKTDFKFHFMMNRGF